MLLGRGEGVLVLRLGLDMVLTRVWYVDWFWARVTYVLFWVYTHGTYFIIRSMRISSVTFIGHYRRVPVLLLAKSILQSFVFSISRQKSHGFLTKKDRSWAFSPSRSTSQNFSCHTHYSNFTFQFTSAPIRADFETNELKICKHVDNTTSKSSLSKHKALFHTSQQLFADGTRKALIYARWPIITLFHDFFKNFH